MQPICAMSVIFFQSLPSFVFFLLFFFLILSLLFFQLFPSLFGSSSPYYSTSYRYNSLNSSSPFLTLHLPIFFCISPYYYSSSNSSPPFFGSSSGPIIPHITITIPPTIHLPSFLFFFFFFFFFFYKFTITFSTPLSLSPSSIQSMFCLPKYMITLLLSFKGFIF